MIPVNELRVGNYVFDNGQIIQIKPEHFVYAAMPDNGLEPIPVNSKFVNLPTGLIIPHFVDSIHELQNAMFYLTGVEVVFEIKKSIVTLSEQHD